MKVAAALGVTYEAFDQLPAPTQKPGPGRPRKTEAKEKPKRPKGRPRKGS